jgi:hypothetical protein
LGVGFPIGSGSFLETGSGLGLVTLRKLTILPTTYIETGSEIGFVQAQNVDIIGGIFTETGTGINFSVARRIDLGSGKFILRFIHNMPGFFVEGKERYLVKCLLLEDNYLQKDVSCVKNKSMQSIIKDKEFPLVKCKILEDRSIQKSVVYIKSKTVEELNKEEELIKWQYKHSVQSNPMRNTL